MMAFYIDPAIAANGVYSWESQAWQYVARIPSPGFWKIVYFAGEVPGGLPPVDCLLLYGPEGYLEGILNHYPVDYPPYESAHNVNVWVKPNRRHRGHATRLIVEALARWPEIDPYKQRYSPAGAALAQSLLERGIIPAQGTEGETA